MTLKLESLANTSRPKKRRMTVGRGVGSGKGKTCGRGTKGMGARSGYKVRHGAEGGGVPLYRRVPTRGFSNERFRRRLDGINLDVIEHLYNNGETVSLETLRERGYLKGDSCGIKILGNGKISKKVIFQVEAISEGAKQKLKEAGIEV